MPGKPKGLPKTGGRTKGTPNKISEIVRNILANTIHRNTSRMVRIMNKSSDEDFVKIYLDILEYIIPKLQRSEIKAEIDTTIKDSIKDAFEGVDDETVQS
jgi:hypothetical protein